MKAAYRKSSTNVRVTQHLEMEENDSSGGQGQRDKRCGEGIVVA